MIKEYQIRDILKRNAIIFHWFDKITLWLLGKPYGSLENHRKDKKILIIRNDHIGDLAQDTGIFREIKRAYPNYKITALVSEEAKPLIEKNYNVDKIIICNLFWRKWWSYKVWKNYFKVLKEIKEEEFDIGIDLRGSFLNIYFFLWKPKIKERIGYYNIGGGKAFLTKPIKLDKLEHTIYMDMKLVEKGLKFKAKNYYPEIITDKEDEKEFNRIMRNHERCLGERISKLICLLPCATRKEKEWGSYNYYELYTYLKEKYPEYFVINLGASNDKDRVVIRNIMPLREYDTRGINIFGMNLRLLSLLFKRSNLVISNDSGVGHIAWISGAKLLTIWGDANMIMDKPLKDSTIIYDKEGDINNIKLKDVINTMEKRL